MGSEGFGEWSNSELRTLSPILNRKWNVLSVAGLEPAPRPLRLWARWFILTRDGRTRNGAPSRAQAVARPDGPD